jgi:NitT/TauT family transport system substrate-binding protein
MSGYITTQTWASAHPAAAKAFQTALEKGNAYANANPSVVRSVIPSYTTMTAAAAATVPLGTYPGTLTTTALQSIATLMKGGGLSTPSDVSSLVLSS